MRKGNSSGGGGSQSRVITVDELIRDNPFPTLVLRSPRQAASEATVAGALDECQGEGQQLTQLRSLMVRLLNI